MHMEIIVNHLTRMQRGCVCAAGVDIATGTHVRPVWALGQLGTDMLARNGGPFDMAVKVDLGKVRHCGHPPELEDYDFNLAQATSHGKVPKKEFWELLSSVAKSRLSELFGPNLRTRARGKCVLDRGKGLASLGCLVTDEPSRLYVMERSRNSPRIQMKLTDGEFDLDLRVTDIRLYKDNHVTPDKKKVRKVARHFDGRKEIILSVCLTRPFQGPESKPVHWLQVNNIHIKDYATWQLR